MINFFLLAVGIVATLFLGEVDSTQSEGEGGGVQDEGEDIEVMPIPFAEAMAKIESGEIQDAKTIVALQHLALRKVGAQT